MAASTEKNGVSLNDFLKRVESMHQQGRATFESEFAVSVFCMSFVQCRLPVDNTICVFHCCSSLFTGKLHQCIVVSLYLPNIMI